MWTSRSSGPPDSVPDFFSGLRRQRHSGPTSRVYAGVAGALGIALAGQHFDQLTLAVAGDAGDADDLTGADCE